MTISHLVKCKTSHPWLNFSSSFTCSHRYEHYSIKKETWWPIPHLSILYRHIVSYNHYYGIFIIYINYYRFITFIFIFNHSFTVVSLCFIWKLLNANNLTLKHRFASQLVCYLAFILNKYFSRSRFIEAISP